MPLLALGINHTTAPVAIRERLAFESQQLPDALAALHTLPGVQEAVVVSTCNRTELYCALDTATEARVADWLVGARSPEDPSIATRLYQHRDDAAVRHLLRVACGLDSLVLGEPQILGQLKQAYELATAEGHAGTQLHRLFQHAFNVAKQVRTDTSIGANPVSVAFAAVSLARQIFGQFKPYTALLIGAGETIELVARHLHAQGVGRLIIANRSPERAHALAAQFQGYAIALEEIPAHLGEADIVIAATASPHVLLTRAMVEQAARGHKAKPVFMADLAVPRDIDPAIGELEHAYLYAIDDLQHVVNDNLRSRRAAAEQAQDIIDAHVELFATERRSLEAVPAIVALRSHADALREQTLIEARRLLATGKAPAAALDYLAHTLTNRLLHAPTRRLRDAARDQDHEQLDTVQKLFDDTDDI